jgi:hypothetical protein
MKDLKNVHDTLTAYCRKTTSTVTRERIVILSLCIGAFCLGFGAGDIEMTSMEFKSIFTKSHDLYD